MAVKTSRPAPTGHTAGIFADMTLDGPEIGTLVVVVDRAKNLPNRKTIGKQDPYCAMRLGKEAKKTDTDRRGGQTPKWDQELRFTVHEAPDYYKLKVSIFNDDKKTDLIGEAFVSLADLIKPGGGSNDLWHQLNYKGKYAGEIRIEMTYYDVRPREEKPVEKRKHKERNTLSLGEQRPSATDVSGPRKLGPREVRRRPVQGYPHQASWPVENAGQAVQALSDYTPRQDTPDQSHVRTDFEDYRGDAVDFQTETLGLPAHRRWSHAYDDTDLADQGQEVDDYVLQQDLLPQQLRTSTNSSRSLPVAPSYEPNHASASEWGSSQRRRSHQSGQRHAVISNDQDVSAYGERFSQPAFITPTTETATHQTDQQYPPHQYLHPSADYDESQYFSDDGGFDEVPPPPPKHSKALRSAEPSYLPSAYVPQPLRPTPIRPFVQERSPLQQIEHGFALQTSSEAQPSMAPNSAQQYSVFENASNTQWMPNGTVSGPKHEDTAYPSTLESRHSSHHTLQREELAIVRDHQDASRIPTHTNWTLESRHAQHHQRIEPSRSSMGQTVQAVPSLPHRPRSHDDQLPQSYTDHQHTEHYSPGVYSQSMPVLPHVVSSDLSQHRSHSDHRRSTQTPARKPISPGPYPEEAGGRRLSGIPFGPDAYDVLNPASSPVTNENTPFETPQQAQWSGRLREARTAQELGPIIDNDGRVIDPSDHLPTSSWAPEPDRKQRRPEHVIHYRTKNDGKFGRATGSSPASARSSMGRDFPSSPMSAPQGSTPTFVNKAAHHNAMPASSRPLPTVPYHQPPQTTMSQSSHHHKTTKRNSYHESPTSLHRPSLSEYQVPVHNNFSPPSEQNKGYQSHQQSPSTMSVASRCRPVSYGDSLAAEMSMIDIGPSRHSGSVVRFAEGY